MKGKWLFVALCALVFTQGRSLAQDKNVTYTITDLGTLGGSFSQAHSINNHREAVGQSRTASGELHGFLWTDGVMTDLNSLIPEGSGWILVDARAINQAGQIAGVGTINGQTHAFLLTPDDENN